MSNSVTLEVFSDYVCPWCYLGDNRVKRLKEEYDIEVKLVHFPLHPETPAEGRSLQELFRCGPEEIEAKNNNMKGVMKAEGLPYSERSHTYNSRLAQEIGKWAETKLGGEAIHDKIYESYFVNRLNVGDIEVIIDIVKSVGLGERGDDGESHGDCERDGLAVKEGDKGQARDGEYPEGGQRRCRREL